MLLGFNVLRTVSGRSTADTLISDIYSHPSLPVLLLSASKDSALHHSLMRAMEQIVMWTDETKKEDVKEEKKEESANKELAEKLKLQLKEKVDKSKDSTPTTPAVTPAAAAEKKEVAEVTGERKDGTILLSSLITLLILLS